MNVPWGNGEWERVLVYGLGVSGRAAAGLLRSRGAEVVAVDRRAERKLELEGLEGDPGVELRLGSEPDELPPGIDGVVVSPGVPMDRPLLRAARGQGLPVIAEVELAFPFLDGPVVAITGSNGKSTTTALTGAILSASGLAAEVCGNIGVPLSACVGGPPGRIFVTELSSFQLEGVVTFRPRAAALLNLSADHLDRYPDLALYARAKQAVFRNQGEGDTAILNADDPEVSRTAVRGRRRVFSSRSPVADGCHLEGERVIEVAPGRKDRELFRRTDLPLPGLHNLENAMAACLLALAAGAGPASLREGMAGFRSLPHRLERVAEVGGVTWYDDSKGTNVAATAGSLEGFPDRSVHLILGGRNKGADPGSLAAPVARKALRLYLIGEAAEEFRQALGELAPAETCGTLPRAVAAAAEKARAGEVVLLSPACASFDQYRDFGERGEHFKSLVRSLTGGADGEEAGL